MKMPLCGNPAVKAALASVMVVAALAALAPAAMSASWKSCCAAGPPTCDYGPACNTIYSGWYCCSAGWSAAICAECGICTTDSDGGNVPLVAGTCNNGIAHSDVCVGSSLREWYCSGNCKSEMKNCDDYDYACTAACSGAGTSTLAHSGSDYACTGTPGACSVTGTKVCDGPYTCDSTKACQSQLCGGTSYKCHASNTDGSWRWDASITAVPSGSERCDGLDNDCDGSADEGCTCRKQGQSCSVTADCCSSYSSGSCYYSASCSGTCGFSSCSLSDYCSGAGRCGDASGDVRNYAGSCGAAGCSFSQESCACGAQDSDGGQSFVVAGTCTDYAGCSGGQCQGTPYADSCVGSGTLREYYVSGSGDSATCSYADKACSEIGAAYECSAGACTETKCDLVSASITPSCAGGLSADCEDGETVTMSGTYAGDCGAADFFQVDAISADGLCDVQYTGGSMSGIWDSSIALDGGAVGSATWVVPAIPSSCKGETAGAAAAALWTGAPGSGTQLDPADTFSGAVTFASGSPGGPTSEFTLAMKPGWNLISIPYSYVDSVRQDDCGAEDGSFYFYDAATGKWNVQTVGIANLKKATSYWFHSESYCSVQLQASGDVAPDDIELSRNEWNDVGAPRGGMNTADLANARCDNCVSSKCTSLNVLYYDTAAGQFKAAVGALEEGVGYRVQCLDVA